MKKQKNIIECYNKTAKNYADKYIDELENKHLDRILLNSFAIENINKGKLIDLGCGPGQTTKYLYDCGMKELVGVDIAPEMVKVAKKINPAIAFEVADILNLQYDDEVFGSAIAFYSIVHFDYVQLQTAFKEIHRVLAEKGEFLLAFHVGEKTVHLDEFLEHTVDIVFYFFDTDKIVALLKETGFEVIDIIERQPYLNAEYPSSRAYIWTKKVI